MGFWDTVADTIGEVAEFVRDVADEVVTAIKGPPEKESDSNEVIAERQRLEAEAKRKEEELESYKKDQEERDAQRDKELEDFKAQQEQYHSEQQAQQERAREAERIEKEQQAKMEEALKKQEEEHTAQREKELEEMRAEREKFQQEQQAQKQRTEEAEKAQQEHQARMEEAMKKKEEDHKAATEEMERLSREREKAIQDQNDLYKRGICPKVWPTEEEWNRARQRMYPDPEKQRFHCAVAGMSGSGKSSLINALRGVKNTEGDSAKIGTVETTQDITAYAHPNSSHNSSASLSDCQPQERFVWYDVPGAGTLKSPGPEYFNSQGLFVFDLIIVMVDTRFTSQDIAILQQCKYFKIPSFIVRSKANQHIRNIMEEEMGYSSDDPDAEKKASSLLEEAKQTLIKKTRESIKENLKEGELDTEQHVYIVSADCLRLVVTATGTADDHRGKYEIDETKLLNDLTAAIVQGRYHKHDDKDDGHSSGSSTAGSSHSD